MGASCCLKVRSRGRAASMCGQAADVPGWGVQNWLGTATGTLLQPAGCPWTPGSAAISEPI